jgi:glucose-1-phosphate adenylyltransferase
MPSIDDVLAVILGGGAGKRLYPLTKQRSKPAVPIASKYRLIDVPISNCINSDIHRIAILTQYNSVSLHRHISLTYNFDAFHRGWVQILAAEQTLYSSDWYQGTADAVRKQLFEIRVTGAEYVLILAGDHLYRMDYEPMAEFHWEHEADITVAVQPIAESDCSRFGLLKRDPDSKISSFVEKPSDPAVLSKFVCRDDPKRPYLGSMGIYLFKTSVLEELLENTTHTDFGGQIIPKALSTHAVFGYDFEGYWEDIGTIRSFYETNLRLAHPDSPFNFYDPDLPIYTHPRFLPGSVIDGAAMINVLLADGCQIHQAEINNSVIGLRSQVADGVSMCDTVLMGADYYDTPETIIDSIPIGVGPNSEIEGAIIDKNVRIGEGVKIKPFPRGTEIDTEKWSVRDGIVVVPKSTILYPRSHIGPE